MPEIRPTARVLLRTGDRGPAVAEVRAWAEREHRDFDAPFDPESPILWRAYDLA